MLKEKQVVLAAIKKNQPVLEQFVVQIEIIAKQSAPGLGDDVVFNVDEDLGEQLADQPNDIAPADCISESRALMTWACCQRSKNSPRLRIYSLPSRITLANWFSTSPVRNFSMARWNSRSISMFF